MISVLVAENNELVLDILWEILESAGHQVTCQPNVDAALETLRNSEIQLLIAALLMPHPSGFELIRQAKILRPQIKIIAITSGSKDEVPEVLLENAIEAGADCGLMKPISGEAMMTTIQELFAEKAS